VVVRLAQILVKRPLDAIFDGRERDDPFARSDE
jgi:hypothetical protein